MTHNPLSAKIHSEGFIMLIVEIGWDGIIESWDNEDGCGQVLIDNEFYQVDNDGQITEKVTVH